ncbi:MAG: hypothetical protein OSB29_01290 [Verrucomicrobiota bacterium]|nr:hypothetical protein [Verrucomicrobiota bacterium]
MKKSLILTALISAATLVAAPKDIPQQKEADWVDARYAKVKFGPFVSGHIATPKGSTHKGIAIRVGEKGEGTMVFDTDLCTWRAGWTGGFLKTDPARYGLIRALKPDGQMVFANPPTPGVANAKGSFADPRKVKHGPMPQAHARYKGLYLKGNRIVIRYDLGETEIYDLPWMSNGQDGTGRFNRTIVIKQGPKNWKVYQLQDASAKIDVKELLRQKPAATLGEGKLEDVIGAGLRRWGDPIVTKGIVDKRKAPFAIDTISVPYKNRFNALFFTAGHDFTSNGDCYVATAHGDVWKVTGIDAELKAVKWHRFATGLYQPLGLRVVKNQVYVLGRDQITRLHDKNGDGEADFYEAFNNDIMIGGGGHSYATCLETDPAGNFYFIRCAEGTPHGGVVLKVTADGSKLSVVATGFRNPNGLGVGPNGIITAADQQGTWVPETRLDVIKPGGFYGFMPSHKRKVAPTTYDPPLVWIPRVLDNSAGGQVWVPKNSWGPLGGELLHFSYGRCTMMHIVRDGANGGVVPLPGRFLSGACRGRFNPKDGHLYVTGLLGWQTSAIRDGSLQRVRFTGEPIRQPIRMKIHANGIRLTFSTPLDKKIAEDIDSWSAEQWNYRWTAAYGSKDWSVKDPNKQGRDPIAIKNAKLLPDGKSVFLQIAKVAPVHSMAIQYNLDTAKGKIFKGTYYLTVNEVGKALAVQSKTRKR